MREHAASDHVPDQGHAGTERPAPGRRTRTERLPQPSGAHEPSAAPESEPVDHAQVAQWMDDAVRPDLAAGSRAGMALPGNVRADMEHSFGADLGSVRIHESAEPAAMGAVAFARGEDLHFAPGGFDPHSASGRDILGHELTHVIQQRNGRAGVHAKGAGGDAALEAEADALGVRAAAGERVEVRGVGAGTQLLNDGDKLAVRPELEKEVRGAGLLPSNRETLLGRLEALLTEAPTTGDARTAVQRAIFDAIVDEESSGLDAADGKTLRAYAESLLTGFRPWSWCRAPIRTEAQRLRHAHVHELGREAFLERLEPHEGAPAIAQRGRYSGAPLLDNTMEISILVTMSNGAGHAFIVFEWEDPHTPQDQLPEGERRRHELYDLAPVSEWRRFQRQQPPIQINHVHGNRANTFPQMNPTNRRSWRVPYAQGALAHQRAAQNVGRHDDEQYALLGWGGDSCITWATHIAEAAGIDARSLLGRLVEIPSHENAGGEAVDSEENMWKPRDEWRALLPRLERLKPRGTATALWCDNLRDRFRRGFSIAGITQCIDACEQLFALSDEGAAAQCEVVVLRSKRAIDLLMGTGEDSLTGAEALEQAVVIRNLLKTWGAMQPRLGTLRGLGDSGPAMCGAVLERFRYSSAEAALEMLDAFEQLCALRGEALAAGKEQVVRACESNLGYLVRSAIMPAKAKRRAAKLRKQLGA